MNKTLRKVGDTEVGRLSSAGEEVHGGEEACNSSFASSLTRLAWGLDFLCRGALFKEGVREV